MKTEQKNKKDTNNYSIQLTREGYDQKKERLNYLINEVRPRVLKELAEARSQGDLFENAEYDAAKDKQAEVQMEINDLEYLLNNTEIIEVAPSSKVSIGNSIKYYDYSKNKERSIKLVGSQEVNPFASEIPLVGVDSPIGKAIIGKKKNDKVEVTTDKNQYNIKILEIK